MTISIKNVVEIDMFSMNSIEILEDKPINGIFINIMGDKGDVFIPITISMLERMISIRETVQNIRSRVGLFNGTPNERLLMFEFATYEDALLFKVQHPNITKEIYKSIDVKLQ